MDASVVTLDFDAAGRLLFSTEATGDDGRTIARLARYRSGAPDPEWTPLERTGGGDLITAVKPLVRGKGAGGCRGAARGPPRRPPPPVPLPQPGGKVLWAGFGAVGRLNADGTPDTAFGASGTGTVAFEGAGERPPPTFLGLETDDRGRIYATTNFVQMWR